jgi:hypothetical protein
MLVLRALARGGPPIFPIRLVYSSSLCIFFTLSCFSVGFVL